jgi:hypothetical protein
MSGDSGVLVVTRVRSTTIIAHEAAGALGIRHSPRPLWAEGFLQDSGAARREAANVCLAVIASAAKQSILSLRRDGLLRCARNDGAGDGLRRGACHRSRIRAPRWPAMTGYPRKLQLRQLRDCVFECATPASTTCDADARAMQSRNGTLLRAEYHCALRIV